MKKILYALIAIPLFILGPLSILICTECSYPDSIPSFFAFLLASIVYYLVVILPLNFIFKKYKNNNK